MKDCKKQNTNEIDTINNDNCNILVSIIIPIYNVEKYLNDCIDSVLRQTYHRLEIILVDDGSTDKCPVICDEYLQKDKRIKVIHKDNGGIADARNAGLEIVHGEYISFVDSDDILSEHMISEMVSVLKTSKADMVAIDFKRFVSEDELKTINESFEAELKIYSRFESIKQLFVKDSIGNHVCNKLIKRECFDTIRFPVGYKMEDLGTMYLILNQCNSIAYYNKQLYYYRQRPGSILHTKNPRLYRDKFFVSKERYLSLKKIYGNFYENEIFMMKTIYQCFLYLENKDDKKWAKNELNYLKRVNAASISKTDIIKSFIVAIFRKCQHGIVGGMVMLFS